MTTLHLKQSIDRLPLRLGFPLIALVLVCFVLAPAPNAFGVSPAPDGGYPNFNTAEGQNALFRLTTGDRNTANGCQTLYNNTTGFQNTATGVEALYNNTSGPQNTADGCQALYYNTTGYYNTAAGFQALYRNTTGFHNAATGYQALYLNTTGALNTAVGSSALLFNTTGGENTATGGGALISNTTGSVNTANGDDALRSNTTGSSNTATGVQALYYNTASNNTANGFSALYNNTTGYYNTANGFEALFGNTTGSNNIAFGSNAGSNLTTGSNNIDIGALGAAGESNTIRIGKVGVQQSAYMQGISGKTVASGVTVIVGSDGHLGTMVSSARFKDAIKPMDNASESILALKPVTFRYKKEIDALGTPQFGLVAEEVAKVNPDLVVRDQNGEIYTVRYEAVNAMLLNEFLKEHRKVEKLTKDFESKLAQQQKQIEALTAGLQKVSAQIELSKVAPQTVLNNP